MLENRPNLRISTRLAVLLFIAVLLTACIPSASLQTPMFSHVQPQLLHLVITQPDSVVGVIVQKTVQDAGVEDLVVALGGNVTKDLPIISAFAAELPAHAVVRVAKRHGVRSISLDAPVIDAGKPCSECIDTSSLLSAYVEATGADRLWNNAPYLQGQDVTVAVVDSGIAQHDDLRSGTKGNSQLRILTNTKFNSFTNGQSDRYGHGTHIAGIIGGNGAKSKGAQIGIAPKVNLINVKVSDDRGAGTTSDVVNGLQWIYDNKDTYNIRVVNLSLNSSVPESYQTNPLDAAIEILWFNGIVVVVSSGNNGAGNNNGVLYPPANDPFVITVGAADDRGTPSTADDVLAPFSAYGVTADGYSKPDLVAPGTNIISLLATTSAELAKGHPEHRVDGFAGGKDYYFRMSGTSMAAAVVSGAAALLLQDEPNLTPDQVKYRLMATAQPFGVGSGAGYLDIYAAIHGTTTESANTNIVASQILWSGDEPVAWNSVNWNSVNWNSVSWNSVSWNSVSWNSVSWNSVSWDDEPVNASGASWNDAVAEPDGNTNTMHVTDTPTEQTTEEQVNTLFLPLINR